MAIPTPYKRVMQAGTDHPKQPVLVHAITDLRSCIAVIKTMQDMKKCPDYIRVPVPVWWKIFDAIGEPNNGGLKRSMFVLGVPIFSR